MRATIRYTMRFTLVDRYDEAEPIGRFDDLLDCYYWLDSLTLPSRATSMIVSRED